MRHIADILWKWARSAIAPLGSRARRREVIVVLLAAGQNVHRRRIDAERARDERVVEFLDLDRVRIGGDRALLALRGQMRGKLTDGRGIVEPLDVLARAGYRHGVEEFEEVRWQHLAHERLVARLLVEVVALVIAEIVRLVDHCRLKR